MRCFVLHVEQLKRCLSMDLSHCTGKTTLTIPGIWLAKKKSASEKNQKWGGGADRKKIMDPRICGHSEHTNTPLAEE